MRKTPDASGSIAMLDKKIIRSQIFGFWEDLAKVWGGVLLGLTLEPPLSRVDVLCKS